MVRVEGSAPEMAVQIWQPVVHSPRLEHRLELIDEEAVSEKAARDITTAGGLF